MTTLLDYCCYYDHQLGDIPGKMIGSIPQMNRSYDLLKQTACQIGNTTVDLEQLKMLFLKEIGSVRRFDCINTMADLINCLEEQDELSESHIEPLCCIATRYGNQTLRQAVVNYSNCTNESQMPIINQYRENRLAEELYRSLHLNNGYHAVAGQATSAPLQPSPSQYQALTQAKRTAIYKVLSQDLGTDWRSFGRELTIKEGIMDDIELQFPRDYKSRVFRLLQLFEEDECHDPKKHVQILCSALIDCQRKDIRRKIENIMSHD